MLRANRGFSRGATSASPLPTRAGPALRASDQVAVSLHLARLASRNLDQLRASLAQRPLAGPGRIHLARPGLLQLPALPVRSLVADRSSELPARTSLNPSRKSTERTTITNGISCTIRAWSSRTCRPAPLAQPGPILLEETHRD